MDNTGFIRAICKNPTDDAPRLLYADWLEERGDPRGEFIRVQCEIAQLPPPRPKVRIAACEPIYDPPDLLARRPEYLPERRRMRLFSGRVSVENAVAAIKAGRVDAFGEDGDFSAVWHGLRVTTRQIPFSSVAGNVVLEMETDSGSVPCPITARHKMLGKRELELYNAHGTDWFCEFAEAMELTQKPVERNAWKRRVRECWLGWCAFRRGFVEVVECGSNGWLRHGPKAVTKAPLTMVILTDKEPAPIVLEGDNQPSEYGFFLGSVNPSRHHVPLELWNLLGNRDMAQRRRYETLEAAMADLSRACIVYARNVADVVAFLRS